MGFWSIAAPIIGGLLGGSSNRSSAQSQNAAARAAAAPQPYNETQTRSPWGPAQPYLEGALPELQRVYETSRDARAPRAPRYRAGRSLGSMSSYEPMQGLAGQMREQAGDQSFVQGAQGFASNLMGGGASNPWLDRTMGQDFNPSAPYLQDWLGGRMGDGAGGGAGGAYGAGGYGGGGGGATAFDRPDAPDIDYDNPLFSAEMQRTLGGEYLEEGNPYVQRMLEALRTEGLEGHARSTADLDRRASAGGRFGSSAHQLRQGMQQEEFDEAQAQAAAGLLGSTYESERGRMMQGLGLSNQRDLGQWGSLMDQYGIDMGSATSRYGADVGAATSRYGINASSRDAAANRRLGQDALTLQGINALTGNQLGGLQLMGGLGSNYLGAQTSALGMVPGLEQAGYTGPQAAFGAYGDLLGMERQDAAARANAANRNATSRYNAQMRERDRPFDLMGRYLSGLGGLGSMGGTTTTEGVRPGNYQPQVNTGAATAQGALGGAAFGRGLAGMFGNVGGGGATNPGNSAWLNAF